MYFDKRIDIQYGISLNGEDLNWTDDWSYLEVNLKTSPFNFSINERIPDIYCSVNAIFRIDGRSYDTDAESCGAIEVGHPLNHEIRA